MISNRKFLLILAGAVISSSLLGAVVAKHGSTIAASASNFSQSYASSTTSPQQSSSPSQADQQQSCNIKGNISINSGKKIYHVPGQKFYNSTKISPEYGERWFCSEAEARAAGWTKAKR